MSIELTPCDIILFNKRNVVESNHTRSCWEEFLVTGKFYNTESGTFFTAPKKLLNKPRSIY